MSGDDDNLLGMIGSFYIRDYVVAEYGRSGFAGEREVDANLSLRGEMRDEVSVFGGDGSGGNAGLNAVAGMWNAIVSVAHGSNQRRNSAERCGGFRSSAAIGYGFSVGFQGESASGFSLVVRHVEQDNFARDLLAPESVEFIEVVDDDYIGGKSGGRSGRVASESSENDLLRCSGDMARIFNELGSFETTGPARDLDIFEMNVESEFAEFVSDIVHGGLGLRGTLGARSDVFGEMGDLLPCIVVGERGVAQSGEITF